MYRVLLVDDENINRMLVKRHLTGYPIEFVEASDGASALKMLRSDIFDLLIFDQMMPGMNGIELMRNLQKLRDNPNRLCPCIAMTAVSARDARTTYMKEGFADYVEKPVVKSTLLELFAKYLRDPSFTLEIEAAPTSGSIPGWLSNMPEVDLDDGLQKNGSLEHLLSSMQIFSNSAEDRANELEGYYENGDIKNYTIRVHALKSSAQIIGANKLAVQAEKLEQAGSSGEIRTIDEGNGTFLLDLRSLAKELDKGLKRTPVDMFKQKTREEQVKVDRRVTILSTKDYLNVVGIREKLADFGISADRVTPAVKQLQKWKGDEELLIFYMDDMVFSDSEALIYLKDLCIGKNRVMILIGTAHEYEAAMKYLPESCIQSWYERPFDMDAFLGEVCQFFDEYWKRYEKKTILLVDDDMAYMQMVKTWLEDSYKVEMADSGTKAITWLAKNHADLVLLDYEIPIIKGPQILEMMRSEKSTSNTPVMFLTGKQDLESILKVVNLRPADYILKTIDRAALTEKLDLFFVSRSLKK